MKTNRLLAVLSILIFAACTKSIKQPLKADSVIQSNATTAPMVTFGHSEIPNDPVWAFHNAYTFAFGEYFIVSDTGFYLKQAKFVLYKTSGCKLTKVKLSIDDFTKTFDITNKKNKDTLTFTLITARKIRDLGPGEWHGLSLTILGDGAANQAFQVKLVSVLFFKKYPQPQVIVPTSGLPELARKCVYP